MDAMNKLDAAVQKVEPLVQRLTATDPAVLRSKLSPLEAAKLDLMVAYTMNSMFWMYLSTHGVNPKEHPVRKELDRIKELMSQVQKVEHGEEAARGASQPSVNATAARRFIKAALGDSAKQDKDSQEHTSKRSKQGADSTPPSAQKSVEKKKQAKGKKSEH